MPPQTDSIKTIHQQTQQAIAWMEKDFPWGEGKCWDDIVVTAEILDAMNPPEVLAGEFKASLHSTVVDWVTHDIDSFAGCAELVALARGDVEVGETIPETALRGFGIIRKAFVDDHLETFKERLSLVEKVDSPNALDR